MTRPPNAEALAEAMRSEETASSGDLARMEASLGRAMRARRTRRPRIAVLGASLALASLALVWLTPRETPAVAPAAAPIASVAVLRAGSELASAEGQLGHAHLVVTGDAHAVVEDDAIAHAVVRLARGEIHVAFHPEQRGLEHLAIVTDVARVEVVGTEFVVTRRTDGTTHVSVREGVVRVITLATNEARDLVRGESLDVAPPADVEVEVETAPVVVSHAASMPAPADRRARIDALIALSDEHHRTDPAAEIEDCSRILVLDPRGDDGATALFTRAQLREQLHDAAAASDYARYLDTFPSGSFAAQAAQHLCALDAARCPR